MNQKNLQILNKQQLFLSNNYEDYSTVILLAETSYKLLHHLFGLGYKLKTFGRIKRCRDSNKLIEILQEVKQKIINTKIPKTKYQAEMIEIKRKSIKNINNIIKTIKGIHNKTNHRKLLRKFSRKNKLGLYLSYMREIGSHYQI